ncbi:hypothetical protein GCM10009712_03440 [Pseudarthrobacter sulfonivorans]|uniref:universal stress protein n=1 Tax=Pseudarthrobacter sulfonivorans TaxID=121292 RepID=UPI0021DF4F21|nr:universal stress protein [Pseudarthrobacter sulfonivorans]
MSEGKRFLVGIDGSEYSPAALRLAGRLAFALGAPLHVVTCLGYSDFYLPERVPPGGVLATPAELEAIARRLMEQALERAFAPNTSLRLSKWVRRRRSWWKKAGTPSCSSWAGGAVAACWDSS